jgi:predicted P-loop ATPase
MSRNKVGAMTKRAGKPGCKFDELLVLEDRQGTNKSTALQVLAIQEDWCGDDLPPTSSGKEVIEQVRGKWIVEVAGLSGMCRAEMQPSKPC